jgi:hypothetical protein
MIIRVFCLLNECGWSGTFSDEKVAEEERLKHIDSQQHRRAAIDIVHW